ncbi:hypothetical protein FrEUN1fDRAFT_7681, partial [Parafrankia sp. EUN1f]
MRAIVRVAGHRNITPHDSEYIHAKPQVGDVARLVVATARGQPEHAGVARIVRVSPRRELHHGGRHAAAPGSPASITWISSHRRLPERQP